MMPPLSAMLHNIHVKDRHIAWIMRQSVVLSFPNSNQAACF